MQQPTDSLAPEARKRYVVDCGLVEPSGHCRRRLTDGDLLGAFSTRSPSPSCVPRSPPLNPDDRCPICGTRTGGVRSTSLSSWVGAGCSVSSSRPLPRRPHGTVRTSRGYGISSVTVSWLGPWFTRDPLPSPSTTASSPFPCAPCGDEDDRALAAPPSEPAAGVVRVRPADDGCGGW